MATRCICEAVKNPLTHTMTATTTDENGSAVKTTCKKQTVVVENCVKAMAKKSARDAADFTVKSLEIVKTPSPANPHTWTINVSNQSA